MARNIAKQNIKHSWSTNPWRFKLGVNREVLIYVNTACKMPAELWALFGSRFSLPPSGKRVMQKKEMLSFSFELGSR